MNSRKLKTKKLKTSSNKNHVINPYLASPMHPITISVIGAGGNGSRMISKLGQINAALKMLDHPGLFVKLFDDDKVERHNIGRQMFSESDIGKYKSIVCIERINRFYGTPWVAITEKINETSETHLRTNLIITCVDNNEARRIVDRLPLYSSNLHHEKRLYWLDMGNGKDRGQFNLSTFGLKKNRLKSLFDLYGYKPSNPDDNQPSCSMEESLRKQDLFVNDLLVTYVSNFLWNILRKNCIITYQGMFLNFETNIITEIPIK